MIRKDTKAMEAGNEHNARISIQLSNMKEEATAAAADGKGYDWTEYFALGQGILHSRKSKGNSVVALF
jgi:hypothetical protein